MKCDSTQYKRTEQQTPKIKNKYENIKETLSFVGESGRGSEVEKDLKIVISWSFGILQ